MPVPIVDLHCDLLFHLGMSSKRSAYDRAVRCGIPQMREGGVELQTMAVFTETEPASVQKGMHQIRLYQRLPELYPGDFDPFSGSSGSESSCIHTLMSFENASGFCDEKEPLQAGFQRLQEVIASVKPLYISLTWNFENRFGGGALTKAGLKHDGKRLLEQIDGLQIALDLSHASDPLAYEAIDYIEAHSLDIPLMASHSNARDVKEAPRNLPDEVAKEIIRRKGLIGLNLVRQFVGESLDKLAMHVAYWLELGGEGSIAMGADFFNDADLPSLHHEGGVFFKELADSSCYPKLLNFLQKELKLSDAHLAGLAHQNALSFFQRIRG
jgi:microsomal dipeptidase-like Zn-dependent dipeptidase